MTIRHKRIAVFSMNSVDDEGATALNLLLETASRHTGVDVEVRSAVGPDIVEVKVIAYDDLITQELWDVFTELNEYVIDSIVVSDDITEAV